MKSLLLGFFFLCSMLSYSQFDSDKNWPKLKFERNSKLNVHKKKVQVKAYPSQPTYSLHDTILVTVEINRVIPQNAVDLTEVPSLKHLASARSIQYGTTSKEDRYAWFVYRVKYLPVKTGAIIINPIALEIEGKVYETDLVKIDIE